MNYYDPMTRLPDHLLRDMEACALGKPRPRPVCPWCHATILPRDAEAYVTSGCCAECARKDGIE